MLGAPQAERFTSNTPVESINPPRQMRENEDVTGQSESREGQRSRLDFFKHGIGFFSALGGFIGALATS